ncbi:hypothetical protein B0I35DRAFT_475193 [Stachybotrys elegans]|uniref:Uncharacterized protein n=1 Tax=Stachybotrys elegans TaxID=80388 RepID=A0A8K0T5K5_9HYPO|nr:hypothetical protein B0I35DRAFT_475193 [Stachybotrys elegans]
MNRYSPTTVNSQGGLVPAPALSPTSTEWTSDLSIPRTMLRRTDSDSDPSVMSDEVTERRGSSNNYKTSSGKTRWFSQVKDWLSVSEPSAQAMKEQKINTYKKHGINLKDPHAAAKLHVPMGRLPANATTSTAGPSPEKSLRKQKQKDEQKKREADSRGGMSRPNHSMSSGLSSNPSIKETRFVAPWEEEEGDKDKEW